MTKRATRKTQPKTKRVKVESQVTQPAIAPNGLNRRQLLFIARYLESFNATEAVIAAGYSDKYRTASITGHRLLRNAKIAERISVEMERLTIPKSEVIARLADMATASLEDFIEPNVIVGKNQIDLDRAKKRGKMHLIKKFKVKSAAGVSSVEIELHDPQAALDKLARMHGLYDDRLTLDWREQAKKDGYDPEQVFREMVAAARARMDARRSG